MAPESSPWRARSSRPGAGADRPRCAQAAGVATRPRGVLAIRPARTRNGSATTSTVSASSPTATASVDSPTGPPPNLPHQRRQHGRGRAGRGRSRRPRTARAPPWRAAWLTTPSPRTSAKSLTRRSSRLAIRGVPRDRPAISSAPSSRSVTPEQAGRPADDHAELGRVVEVQVPGEAEPVAQRRGQQPGPGGRADQGERRDVQRHRGRARALAEHHVDPEVLHRQVEHLLGGPGQPVDLVDEHDLAARSARSAPRPGRRPARSPGRW